MVVLKWERYIVIGRCGVKEEEVEVEGDGERNERRCGVGGGGSIYSVRKRRIFDICD